MLYDNALILHLLTTLYRTTSDDRFKTAVFETIHWALRDLHQDDGSFASSYDADSEGVEGRFYIWTYEEVKSLLKPGEERFLDIYGIQPEGNWELSLIHI